MKWLNTYKINFKCVLKMFLGSLYAMFILAILLIHNISNGKIPVDQSGKVYMIILLTWVGPVLFLFIDYITVNYSINVKTNRDFIEISGTNAVVTSSIQDIKKITVYLTPALYVKSNLHLYPLDGCFVLKLELPNQADVFLTNLMLTSDDLPFLEEVPKETKKMLLPFVSLIKNSLAF